MPPFPKLKTSRSSAKVGSIPSGSGSMNPLVLFMLKDMYEKKMEQENRNTIGQDAADLNAQTPGGAPPGTTITREGTKYPVNREYTNEEAKDISGADSITRHINYIKGQMDDPVKFRNLFTKSTLRIGGGEKGKVFGMPMIMGDKEAQKLSFSIKDMENRLIYLRSGKQINDQEFDRLSATLPSYTDISDKNDTTFENLKFKLDNFKSDLDSIKGRLIEGGNYDSNAWESDLSQGSQSPFPFPGNQQQVQQQPQQDNNDPLGIFQ